MTHSDHATRPRPSASPLSKAINDPSLLRAGSRTFTAAVCVLVAVVGLAIVAVVTWLSSFVPYIPSREGLGLNAAGALLFWDLSRY